MSIFRDLFNVKQSPIFTGSRFGFGAGAAGPTVSDAGSIIATGGNQSPSSGLTPGNGYKYHTFTSPGELTLTSGSGNVEVLVVAGGGGGGNEQSGGGGAGGLAYNPSTPIKATLGPYAITVGNGGNAQQPGSPSTAIGIIALGGGRGVRRDPSTGGGTGSGGSGGGGGSQDPSAPHPGTQPGQPQPAGTSNYGNPGGSGTIPVGGGGGGAGASGSNGPPGAGGNGRQYPQFTGPLIGVPALNPLSGYFAGGGGGRGDAAYGGSPANAPGGAGGGGQANRPTGDPGVANSGGGGGGSSDPGPGGSGGSGIVVIRYPD
tara:strand:+ start:482 stop:1429 length:948 start_codon:yes stop_codon:yes gene_type:complete